VGAPKIVMMRNSGAPEPSVGTTGALAPPSPRLPPSCCFAALRRTSRRASLSAWRLVRRSFSEGGSHALGRICPAQGREGRLRYHNTARKSASSSRSQMLPCAVGACKHCGQANTGREQGKRAAGRRNPFPQRSALVRRSLGEGGSPRLAGNRGTVRLSSLRTQASSTTRTSGQSPGAPELLPFPRDCHRQSRGKGESSGYPIGAKDQRLRCHLSAPYGVAFRQPQARTRRVCRDLFSQFVRQQDSRRAAGLEHARYLRQ